MNLDYETQSRCDLKACGAYRYATDPSTRVLVACYSFGLDQEVKTWLPAVEPIPEDFRAHVEGGGEINAWNAQFEFWITRYVLRLSVELEQFRCTAALARSRALPGALGLCADALKLHGGKSVHGSRLIREYSIPVECDRLVPWQEIGPTDQGLWVQYCQQDVRVEQRIGLLIGDWDQQDLEDYWISERINLHGVCVDVGAAQVLRDQATDKRGTVNDEIQVLTGGVVKKHTERKSRDIWLLPRLTDEQQEVISENNVAGYSLDSHRREQLLARDDLAPEVERFLELLDEAGGATISKYAAILNRAVREPDDWVMRGLYLFNGAGATGRFSSTGIQVHNLKRSGDIDADALIDRAYRGEALHLDDIGKLVRSMFIAPSGGHLVWGDWSSIEARVLPWLAGAEEKLELFRQGRDVYIENAARTFHVPAGQVTKHQRQIGKVQELSMGFGGGKRAFAAMGKNYGMTFSETEAETFKAGWRLANPWAPAFWQMVESAVWRAFGKPGRVSEAGRLKYLYRKDLLDGSLWTQLPSGRLLCYPQFRLDEDSENFSCLAGQLRPKKGEKEWPRKSLWYGTMVENATQAVANDIQRALLRHVDDVVLHTHDEIVMETFETPEDVASELAKKMATPPGWAIGLPLEADCEVGVRYGK